MRCKKCLKIDRKGEAAWEGMVLLWLRCMICIRPIGWHGSATCSKCGHTVLWSVAREDENRENSRNLQPSPLQGRCHDLSARRKIIACSCGENLESWDSCLCVRHLGSLNDDIVDLVENPAKPLVFWDQHFLVGFQLADCDRGILLVIAFTLRFLVALRRRI